MKLLTVLNSLPATQLSQMARAHSVDLEANITKREIIQELITEMVDPDKFAVEFCDRFPARRALLQEILNQQENLEVPTVDFICDRIGRGFPPAEVVEAKNYLFSAGFLIQPERKSPKLIIPREFLDLFSRSVRLFRQEVGERAGADLQPSTIPFPLVPNFILFLASFFKGTIRRNLKGHLYRKAREDFLGLLHFPEMAEEDKIKILEALLQTALAANFLAPNGEILTPQEPAIRRWLKNPDPLKQIMNIASHWPGSQEEKGHRLAMLGAIPRLIEKPLSIESLFLEIRGTGNPDSTPTISPQGIALESENFFHRLGLFTLLRDSNGAIAGVEIATEFLNHLKSPTFSRRMVLQNNFEFFIQLPCPSWSIFQVLLMARDISLDQVLRGRIDRDSLKSASRVKMTRRRLEAFFLDQCQPPPSDTTMRILRDWLEHNSRLAFERWTMLRVGSRDIASELLAHPEVKSLVRAVFRGRFLLVPRRGIKAIQQKLRQLGYYFPPGRRDP